MFVRHVGLAAVAAVAAFSQNANAQTPSNPPPAITIHSGSEAAYTYSNEPFQCVQPTVDLQVNATHVYILTTSYSQQEADTRTTNGPAGRTQFAFGTFLSNVAYPTAPFWDPAAPTAVTTADMFGTTYLTGNVDTYLNMGSCGLGKNAGDSFVNVTQLTIAPTFTADENTPSSSLTSIIDAGNSVPMSGCDCATYAVTADGVVDLTLGLDMSASDNYVCPITEITDTTTNHIFYTKSGSKFNGRAAATIAGQKGITQASTTNSWSYRQTTCGANDGDECGTATDDGAIPFTGKGITSSVDSTTATCSIRTEALLIMPVEQFIIVMKDNNNAIVTNSASGGSSNLQYTWEDYVIEYASTAAVDATNGVDVFQTRVTPSRFKLNLYPAGAVVQSLGVGDVAPPMLLHTTATGNTGAVAWAQRVNANTLKMTWQFDAFVQQSTRATVSSAYDTVFKSLAGTGGDGMRVEDDVTSTPILLFTGSGASNFNYTCDPWYTTQNELTDQTTLTTTSATPGVITSGYGCANSACAPYAQSKLPSDLLSGLTAGALAKALFWVQYHVTVVCTINHFGGTPYVNTDPFRLPTTTIRMKYRLADDVDGNELTDMSVPPFSDIVQVGYTAPGTLTSDISFNLTASMIQLKETDIRDAEDLTDLVYTSEDNSPLPGQLVYSEAMAVKVQIDDAISETNTGIALPADAPGATAIGNIRNAWQLQPALMLMVAHDTSKTVAAGFANGYEEFTSSTSKPTPADPLDVTWCGLDQTDAVVAVWSVQDTRTADGNVAGTYLAGYATSGASTLTKLGPVYNNIVDSLSSGLKDSIGNYVMNNVFTGIADLQTDILGGVPGTLFTNASLAAGSYTNVAIVPDATGGFAFPLRNRFFINGKASGYQLSFCTITQAIPYLAMAIGDCASEANCNAFYPAYTTYAAALADTLSVNGVVSPPQVLNPSDVAGGAWVKYYMPSKPASTSGKVCIPNPSGKATLVAGFPDANVVNSHVSSTGCYTLINAAIAQSQAAGSPGVACDGPNAQIITDGSADNGLCGCDAGYLETAGQTADATGNVVTTSGACNVPAPAHHRRMLSSKPLSHILRPKIQASVFSMALPSTKRNIPPLSTVKVRPVVGITDIVYVFSPMYC